MHWPSSHDKFGAYDLYTPTWEKVSKILLGPSSLLKTLLEFDAEVYHTCI